MSPDQNGQPSVTTEGAGTPDAGAQASAEFNPFPFEEAFGPQREPAAAAAVPAPEEPGGHPAAVEASAPASTPAGSETPPEPESSPAQAETGGTPSPLSRRQSAREEDAARMADLQRMVDEAIAERDRAAQEADAARQQVADQERRDAAARAAYLTQVGDDAEYERRSRISNLMRDPYYAGDRLTVEQEEELARWTRTRELRDPFIADADARAARFVESQLDGQRTVWVREALTVADEIGLPRDVLARPENANLGALLRAASESTAARIRDAEVRPLQERISQLEAHTAGLETRVVHAQRAPVIGGMSGEAAVPGSGNQFDPSLSWDENWRRAFGSPESGATGT